MKKYLNKYLNVICKKLKISPTLTYPYLLMLEPTNLCNLSCPLCPTGNGSIQHEKGFMEWELFENVVNEVSPYIFKAFLWGFGEPFLHPKIFDMIEYLNFKQVTTIISTNGTKLYENDFLERIIKSNLKELIISLDGASSETYIKYRKGGNFNEVVLAIEKLQKLKSVNNKIYPKIQLQFIIMQHNEHEIDTIKQLAKKLNVILRLKTVSVRNESDMIYIPKNLKYSRYQIDKGCCTPKTKQPIACPYAWSWATINYDGSVVSCCKDPYREHLMGNLLDDNFINVWNSRNFKNFRKQLTFDKVNLRCYTCVQPSSL